MEAIVAAAATFNNGCCQRCDGGAVREELCDGGARDGGARDRGAARWSCVLRWRSCATKLCVVADGVTRRTAEGRRPRGQPGGRRLGGTAAGKDRWWCL